VRISRLVLKNYRQFKDVEITFNKSKNNDLHILIGLMGTGKTNLLNAINWCLYGDEPYLSKKSQQLPLLNLKTIEQSEEYQHPCVEVQVWMKTEGNRTLRFVRKTYFKMIGKKPQSFRNEFQGNISDQKGNWNPLSSEEAESYIERFVPKRIREFFFFDGDRLDRYFKDASGQNVQSAIFNISQLDLAERIYDRLTRILSDLRKKAGKVSPKIEETRRRLEEKEYELKNVEKRIAECKRQISIAKGKIEEYEEKLREIPDIEDLEKRRKDLKSRRKEKRTLLEAKEKEKLSLLVKYGKLLMLWPAIKKSIEEVEEKKEIEEIPPTIDRSLLESTIKNCRCAVCGRELDNNAKDYVKDLVQKIKLSTNVAQELMRMEVPLRMFEDELKNFEEIGRIAKEISGYEKDLKEIESEINKIDEKLRGYDTEKIKEWHKQRTHYEDIRDKNQQNLGVFIAHKKELVKEINELKKQLEDELKKEEKVKELKNKMDSCANALNILEKTKNNILDGIRKEIERETMNKLLELMWKKKTFADVKIEENYNVKLIHAMGYECLGTISSGEREALTLAFTVALHKISGFDSPIIVDRPLAMVSGEPRTNIVKVFTKISQDKQTILLFTPDDFSEEIAEVLNQRANKFKIKMVPDEKEAKIEVI